MSRTCLECGFLTIEGSELDRPSRIMLSSGGASAKMPARSERTRCFKNLWEYDVHYTGDSWPGVKEEIEASRDDCPGFRKYDAGFDPASHLEHQVEDRQQAMTWRIARLGFWGAMLGGAISAAVGALIAWLV
jgi:hypothetical protein